MTVCRGIPLFVDIFQGFHGPAREVLAAVLRDAGEGVHIRPVFIPVCAECHKSAVRNRSVFFLIVPDILRRHRIVDVFRHLVGDINYTEREYALLHPVGLRERSILDEMSREINMGTELSRELKGVNPAVQHGIAPVKHHLSKLYAPLRNTAPVGAVVVEAVGEFHPSELLCIFQ